MRSPTRIERTVRPSPSPRRRPSFSESDFDAGDVAGKAVDTEEDVDSETCVVREEVVSDL